ncbi:MAG: protease inhibitor I42 family protein [Acidimicrobiia bacterium]
MLRRRSIVATLLTVALMSLALGACADSDSKSASTTSTGASSSNDDAKPKVYTEDDTKIAVSLEHEFIVELPATPSTGYAWTAVTNPALQQMTTEQIQGGSQPGAQGTQRITFRSQAVGKTTLTLNYARSFEPSVPPAKSQTYDVTVKDG